MSIGAGDLMPKENAALLEAVQWIDAVLLGPIVTSIAVVAVALLGFAMLTGRINIRRALSVLLGCFLLFGARGISEGLRSFGGNEAAPSITADLPPPVYPDVSTAKGSNSNAFDPYAGAAVIRSTD